MDALNDLLNRYHEGDKLTDLETLVVIAKDGNAAAELAALRAERDTLMTLLRATEFSQHDDVRDDYFCEFCHGYQETGHNEICKLAAALKGDA